MLFWLSKTKRVEIYFSIYAVFTKLTKFSLKCHQIHPEIHKGPSMALRLRVAYDTLMAAMVVAGIVS